MRTGATARLAEDVSPGAALGRRARALGWPSPADEHTDPYCFVGTGRAGEGLRRRRQRHKADRRSDEYPAADIGHDQALPDWLGRQATAQSFGEPRSMLDRL